MICYRHGPLDTKDIYIRKRQRKSGLKYLQECKICKYISAEKQRAKSSYRIFKKGLKQKDVDNLSDGYIKDRLQFGHGFDRGHITPDIIELKRAQLRLVRAIRDIKNGNKERKKNS